MWFSFFHVYLSTYYLPCNNAFFLRGMQITGAEKTMRRKPYVAVMGNGMHNESKIYIVNLQNTLLLNSHGGNELRINIMYCILLAVAMKPTPEITTVIHG